ncbi:DUF4743 domain-containing protein [Pseudomonadota bacterium]
MSFFRHIQCCNQHTPSDFISFFVNDQLVGRFRHVFAERLSEWPDVFCIRNEGIHLNPSYADYAQRTQVIADVLQALFASGEHAYLLDEMYGVSASSREEALFEIDRSAAMAFGIRTFGQHLNGFVRKSDGLYMWIAKRAADRRTFPGMLDHLVAGGLPINESLDSNLRKECMEEAGIAPELADTAIPVGTVSYNIDTEKGFKYDTLYCYDLELPESFIPRCTDGEVESFELMPIEDVMRTVLETDDFKLNCNLVIIDFLLRQGCIRPEHEEYLDLVTSLRPVIYTPER